MVNRGCVPPAVSGGGIGECEACHRQSSSTPCPSSAISLTYLRRQSFLSNTAAVIFVRGGGIHPSRDGWAAQCRGAGTRRAAPGERCLQQQAGRGQRHLATHFNNSSGSRTGAGSLQGHPGPLAGRVFILVCPPASHLGERGRAQEARGKWGTKKRGGAEGKPRCRRQPCPHSQFSPAPYPCSSTSPSPPPLSAFPAVGGRTMPAIPLSLLTSPTPKTWQTWTPAAIWT